MKNKINYDFPNFGPFVFKSKLSNNIIQRLLEEANKCQQSHNEYLAGHLENQFAYPKEIIKEFYTDFAPYLKTYRQGHCAYHKLDPSVSIELQPIDLWVNFMKSGDFNPMHTHRYDISFVTYLSVPEEIHKENKNFKGASSGPGTITFNFTQMASPKWATTQQDYLPRTGDVFIFPAQLQHWVAPFKSDVTRISVSGNLLISNKDQFDAHYF